SREWAQRLGLEPGITVGVGAFDCHMGAVGGQIEPYYLSKVMGTSTCDMLVAPPEELQGIEVQGICGQVPGSIVPGMIGMEAGQSAFGDAYAWFRNLVSWPLRQVLSRSALIDGSTLEALIRETEEGILGELSAKAAALDPAQTKELALDWLNGRRTPDADQALEGAFTGLNLATDAPRMFRALAEATCFGARAIVERFRAQGVPVKGLIGLGGVARKAPFIMQLMADVMDMPIRIHRSEQTCALGAAMFAATAAGLYPDVTAAMKAMGPGFDLIFYPDPERARLYASRYARYRELGGFVEGKRIVREEAFGV
ncbi:MAG TPA: FGGY-family carbohydrate kinase, partial [Chitinophagaceae bacterium]|nr:FGGY-family carbohydrate kinase [Chitinophagaceae bacterium]